MSPDLSQPQKKTEADGRALLFTDEASFRQDSTLHATWARVAHPPQVPVTGERKSIKILGAVEMYKARFRYKRDMVFNGETYLAFVKDLTRPYRNRGAVLVQDNASYHKDADVWAWFRDNRHWLEVHNLPSYSPEFNPTERLWKHTRKNGTHNRSFLNLAELDATLTRVFTEMQEDPRIVRPYLASFL